MNHAVVNFSEIDLFVDTLGINSQFSFWFSKVFKKEVVTRRDWLIPSSSLKFDDVHVQTAIDRGDRVFDFTPNDFVKNETQYVIDWLAELEQRDPRLFSKLDRITWKQAVEHSKRWHEALARKAEKLKSETIPFDENCPVVLECDDGLKWVWLKTDKARDDEGRIMGHCVGQGGYDDLNVDAGVFSLRDIDGHPHVTVELYKMQTLQSVMKGNSVLSKKYEDHVEILRAKIGLKLWFLSNPLLGFDVNESGDIRLPNVTLHVEGDVLHSKDDLPSIVWKNGGCEWFRHGIRHRDGGPARIIDYGSDKFFSVWYENGVKIKSESNLPNHNCSEYYNSSGFFHREDGPAVIRSNGDQEWRFNSELHREDGPAIVKADGGLEWWVNGRRHRNDGPAIINEDGTFGWYQNGDLHREDGPALIMPNGDEEWYRHGNLHREDGPATDHICGDKGWFFENVIHRDDGPAVILADGTREWYQNGRLHREDGPAVEYANGDLVWWQNGRIHRSDGPAVERRDGTKEWWVNGVRGNPPSSSFGF